MAHACQQQSWFAITLRLIVGCGFMEHGYAKLARCPQAFANILRAFGTPMPALLAWATILVELFGGLARLVGTVIPLASIQMIIVLLGAIFTIHVSNGLSSIKLQSVDAMGAHFGKRGYETDLLYVAGLIAAPPFTAVFLQNERSQFALCSMSFQEVNRHRYATKESLHSRKRMESRMQLKDQPICSGCEHAVIATYLELLELGTSEVYAFQTCVTLYRIHDPAISMNDARSTVAEWIDHAVNPATAI